MQCLAVNCLRTLPSAAMIIAAVLRSDCKAFRSQLVPHRVGAEIKELSADHQNRDILNMFYRCFVRMLPKKPLSVCSLISMCLLLRACRFPSCSAVYGLVCSVVVCARRCLKLSVAYISVALFLAVFLLSAVATANDLSVVSLCSLSNLYLSWLFIYF